MSIEVIQPTDEQHWLECRTKDITSTEVSALFGFSPYITEFELWHRKKSGTVVKLEGNERMKWGTALQDAIASEVAKEKGWNVRRMNEYLRDPITRAGASFDFSIESLGGMTDDDINDLAKSGTKFIPGLLEIKNVDGLQFKQGWKEDEEGNVEAPLHIEIQVQQQLMVSERPYCYIGALVGGNRLVLIKRESHKEIQSKIRARIKDFWASVESGIEPKPNFQRDADFIAKLYGYAEPGKILDVRGNEEFIKLAREHKRLGDSIKEAEEQRDALKAQMLIAMGDAEKVEGGEFSISAGIIGESPVSYVRKAYRNFKPSWRKAK